MADSAFMEPPEYGHSLHGFGVNLLVRDVAVMTGFLRDVFRITPVYEDKDFAVIRHDAHEFMLHGDHTYHDNPLLSLTGDGALRGAGVEFRLYDMDPDAAETKAREKGFDILQSTRDKPHGLRECYIIGPEGYVFVPAKKI